VSFQTSRWSCESLEALCMLYEHCDHQLVTTEGEYDVRALSPILEWSKPILLPLILPVNDLHEE
jgi:hypothetical protein